jgi:N utilization substance protein B
MSDTTHKVDQRHLARALALQKLFSKLTHNQDPLDIVDLIEELEAESIPVDDKFIEQLTSGVIDRLEKLDELISSYAPEWPIAQIAPVDLIILRLAIFEAFVGKITPAKVAINEAIELAKEFGGENSKSFINGVLGNIYRERYEDTTNGN